jgi:uncharacterized protein (DUF952 family)
MRVLHLAEVTEWEAAQTTGEYRWSTRGRTLAQEGFIHASTSTQLPGVVQRFYADVDPTDYVLLVVDIDLAETAGTTLRWEIPPGVPSAPDTVFPHFYGPIPVTAVITAVPLTAWNPPAGEFALPDLTGLDVAVTAPQ